MTIKSEFDLAAEETHAPNRKDPPPLSVRLTWEERAQIRAAAGRRSMGAYVREKLFGDNTAKRRFRRNVVADSEALARLAGHLGQSRISSNLNQLAKAANMGSLMVDDEVRADLEEACAHVQQMRQILMTALDMRESSNP